MTADTADTADERAELLELLELERLRPTPRIGEMIAVRRADVLLLLSQMVAMRRMVTGYVLRLDGAPLPREGELLTGTLHRLARASGVAWHPEGGEGSLGRALADNAKRACTRQDALLNEVIRLLALAVSDAALVPGQTKDGRCWRCIQRRRFYDQDNVWTDSPPRHLLKVAGKGKGRSLCELPTKREEKSRWARLESR